MDNRAYYDLFAATYEQKRHGGYHLMVDRLESDLVTSRCAGKSVLEAGCGTGLILARVAQVAREAVGIDLSPAMLERARDKGLKVVEAEITQLPFAQGRFDITYSFKVLSHVRELTRALAEMSRVTKPGGTVLIELYNKTSLRYWIRLLRGGKAIASGVDDNQVFFRFYNLKEMVACLPDDLDLVHIHGVRVFTVLPAMVGWPGVGPLLRRLESASRSRWPGRFGGFLILECTKRAVPRPAPERRGSFSAGR